MQKQKGFTIVELLIVVVVIAILAAITIVSYNGIQNRARNSAAEGAASQTAKKVAAAFILNGELYPTLAGLAAATGYTPSTDGSTPYEYTVSSDQKTFCMTTTTGGISSFVSNANSSPSLGACPGHRLNGVAVVVITNLVVNPSVESAASGWSLHASLDGGRVQVGGKWVIQGTRNATAATAIYVSQSLPSTVTASTTYTGSVLVTTSVAQSLTMQVRLGGSNTVLFSDVTAVPANTPTRISTTGSVGANTSAYLTVLSSSGTVGTVISADEAMLTAGTTVYPYADGNTAGWSWNGTANLSASTGPAL